MLLLLLHVENRLTASARALHRYLSPRRTSTSDMPMRQEQQQHLAHRRLVCLLLYSRLQGSQQRRTRTHSRMRALALSNSHLKRTSLYMSIVRSSRARLVLSQCAPCQNRLILCTMIGHVVARSLVCLASFSRHAPACMQACRLGADSIGLVFRWTTRRSSITSTHSCTSSLHTNTVCLEHRRSSSAYASQTRASRHGVHRVA